MKIIIGDESTDGMNRSFEWLVTKQRQLKLYLLSSLLTMTDCLLLKYNQLIVLTM
jgi:hypothetical protein